MASFAIGSVGGLTEMGAVCLHVAALWPHPPTVIEADPDGGRLAVRYDWDLRPSLVEFADILRSGNSSVDPIRSAARRLRSGVTVVVGAPGMESACSSVGVLAESMAALEECAPGDVLVDVGIVRPGSPARDLIVSATRRIIVVRKEVDDLVALAHRHELLESLGEWSVLTAGGSLRLTDVMDAIQWPILADLLPHDRKSSSRLRVALARIAGSSSPAKNPSPA